MWYTSSVILLSLAVSRSLGFTHHHSISVSKPPAVAGALSFQRSNVLLWSPQQHQSFNSIGPFRHARARAHGHGHGHGHHHPSSKSLGTKLQMSSATQSSDKPSAAAATATATAVLTSIASTAALIALDIAFRKLLKAMSISFPSSLAGCGTLFTTLVALYSIKPALGDSMYNLFAPGAAVLAKWLPVFFVPSLVTLPLAQSLGSSLEVSYTLHVIRYTLYDIRYTIYLLHTLHIHIISLNLIYFSI